MNNNYDYQRHGFLNAWEAVFLIKAFFYAEHRPPRPDGHPS